jgi:hypothetical protein
MFEATKKLIEHCKHLGLMADLFARPLYEAAEKEILQIESQLTLRTPDFAPESRTNCTYCGGLLPKHNLPCEMAQSG